MAPGSLWLQEDPHCDAILWFTSSALRPGTCPTGGHFLKMQTAGSIRLPPKAVELLVLCRTTAHLRKTTPMRHNPGFGNMTVMPISA